MRRVVTALLVTVVVVVLLVSFKARTPAIGTSPATLAATPPRTSTTAKTTTSATTTKATSRRRRTATGDAVTTRYGVVQVAVTTVGGRLTAVRTLAMTADNGRSQEIDAQAEPLLRQEALSAGSAQIDTVSGATYTSEGYAQSLQSALDRARAA